MKPRKIGAEEYVMRRNKVVDLARNESEGKCQQLLLCIPSSRTYYMAKGTSKGVFGWNLGVAIDT